jgi:AbiV family abortive infection protein
MECARVLAVEQLYGPAVAHLIYAIEETEKARSLGQIWINSWQGRRHGDAADDELRDRIFGHPARHKAAAAKSFATGPFWTMMAESTRERVHLSPPRTPQERLAMAYAEHPEALPLDWADRAEAMREAALYVDLRDGSWQSPGQMTVTDYEQLRPMVVAHLRYTRAAFEQHKWEFERRPTS